MCYMSLGRKKDRLTTSIFICNNAFFFAFRIDFVSRLSATITSLHRECGAKAQRNLDVAPRLRELRNQIAIIKSSEFEAAKEAYKNAAEKQVRKKGAGGERQLSVDGFNHLIDGRECLLTCHHYCFPVSRMSWCPVHPLPPSAPGSSPRPSFTRNSLKQ